MRSRTVGLTTAMAVAALAACSRQPPVDPAADAGKAPAAATVAAPARAEVAQSDTPVPGGADKACNRLTARELSAILGTAMTATPNDGTEGITQCAYGPAGGTGPSVEFMVIAGDGASTLRMVREKLHYDPAPARAFAGIGDDVDVQPPTVLIRDGEDLVSLMLVGVDDEPAVARKILAASH